MEQQEDERLPTNEAADEVTVVLSRGKMETWISWGMMVSEYTMALTGWVKGSSAAASAQLHTCLGWVRDV